MRAAGCCLCPYAAEAAGRLAGSPGEAVLATGLSDVSSAVGEDIVVVLHWTPTAAVLVVAGVLGYRDAGLVAATTGQDRRADYMARLIGDLTRIGVDRF